MNPSIFGYTKRAFLAALAGTMVLLVCISAQGREQRVITGHIPKALAGLKPTSRLAATNHLQLVLGLPLRNQAALDGMLNELTDPSSTNYHRWLTPDEFSNRFGPTPEDFLKVVEFVRKSGLKITGLASNRMLVNVDAPVADIEKTFHVALRVYPHPQENRYFYAPDSEPTVDSSVPILHVAGMDNYVIPHRIGEPLKPVAFDTNQIVAYATGSSPGGFFMGSDFRKAYVPGVTNTGVGQYIAIIDVGGPYYMKDVTMYQTNAGLSTNIVVTNILLSGWNGIPNGATNDEGEEVLDIDMAMSMAPGATILNYEGEAHDVFNRIAIDNKAKQMTLSYGFGIDASIMQMFQQFVAQGQAFSQASGDGGGDMDGGTGLTGNPYATIVGGTSLTTSGSGGPWQSDVTWGGSGGGISGYGIPTWQQGINMTANLGSTNYRNYPDISMPAVNVFTIYRNGTVIGATGGTSAASPLWAGFMALVNEAAAAQGKPAVGFVNPAIYAIGKGPSANYLKCFHDITSGNTFNSQNPNRFAALPGYDLATGWGTPTGSNTIAALIGTGTNDFTFFASKDVLNIVRGGADSTTLTMTHMNGLTGSITYSITGLPSGATAVFNPVSTTNATLLTITADGTTAIGTNLLTVIGAVGDLTHTNTLSLIVAAPIPGAMQVDLSSIYNRSGIWSDRRTFGIGVDGSGFAYSANLLSSFQSWNGIAFSLGSPNVPDAVSCAGQVIPLTAGNFSSVEMLGTAVQGSQSSQRFTVTYTDNSSTTITQSMSDWAGSQNLSGEFQIVNTAYRNNGGGGKDLKTSVSVYGYSLALDQTKTVKSIALPSNPNVIVLALALANEPVAASLNAFFNRAGMYTDDTTFTNPATGGIDGGGAAYSASLLTGSQIWRNTPFNFGPANATNVISAAGQTIALPPGNFTALRMLASAVQGSQPSQTFSVKYADGTTTNIVQSLSDWYSPQGYPGETKAVTMGHRNSSDGTKDNRTFYLYGYSFTLNSTKVVQSLKLPNNPNIIVTAVSLVPNWPPTFKSSPFAEPSVTAGQLYSANLATNIVNLDGDTLTFAKVTGPDWLTVRSNGTLTGTPVSSQVGTNSFVISVSDAGGLSNTATMNINVLSAAPIVSTISGTATNLSISWTGGVAPYQAQISTDLSNTNWVDFGDPTSSNSILITPTNSAAFYRITGQ